MTAGLECRGCHRPLKRRSPTGYGPVCARKRGLVPTKGRRGASRRPKPAKVAPAANALPGQTELELFFHQPTLESL